MHERFSYPDNPCMGETEAHQCDLPNGHNTRHLCGECGRPFDATRLTKKD